MFFTRLGGEKTCSPQHGVIGCWIIIFITLIFSAARKQSTT
jgi:hypothetical protein